MPKKKGLFKGREDDIIILVMGLTGAGKSTFIKEYTGNETVAVGHELESCTRNVTGYETSVPRHASNLMGRRLILVDTPGLDGTFLDDSEVLKQVFAWLAQSYTNKVTVAGIIYINDISQKRILEASRLSPKTFVGLCGGTSASFDRIVLATSQWDSLREQSTGLQREEELTNSASCQRLGGAKIMRIQEKPADHQKIIDYLLVNHKDHQDQDEAPPPTLNIATKLDTTIGFRSPLNASTHFPRGKRKNRRDIVILFIGATGAGKSAFIKEHTGNNAVVVGHQLKSCTDEVDCFEATMPSHLTRLRGRRLFLVDTPGFNNTFLNDYEVLQRISTWLVQSYRRVRVAGIVYMQDISGRIHGSHLKMFGKLCGKDFFTKVVLATAQWDVLPRHLRGPEQENKIKSLFLKHLPGATAMRIQDKPADHVAIINHVLNSHLKHPHPNRVLLIQKEIIDQGKTVPATQAGRGLKYTLSELVEIQQWDGGNDLGDQSMRRRAIKEQLKALKPSFGDRMRALSGLA